jgi:N-acetylglucosaminyldiphosphoundecaprenol N-acetyl-beta-D-mannosaminyltransferase
VVRDERKGSALLGGVPTPSRNPPLPEAPRSVLASRAPSEDILGFPVFTGPIHDLAHEVMSCVDDVRTVGGWLACLNPHSYALAHDNLEFGGALRQATWLVPDGSGIVLASRWFGGRIRQRLCGPDAFIAISSAFNARGPFKVLFLGSTPATLAAIARQYRADFPNVTAVDTHSPPFRDDFDEDDVAAMRDVVRCSAPDLLWVGLTAPKQELLLHRLGADSGYRFAAAIGAAFDFYAGNVRRSAPVFRRLGLEWLPRLIQEPRRLWRRTFVSAPRFLLHVAVRALMARAVSEPRAEATRRRR